jgi:hypothetical protein
MASKICPVLDTFDIIKHDLSYLEVTTKLHPFHQIKSAPFSIHRHLEREHLFSKLLSWKTTILDVIITTISLEHQNARDMPYGRKFFKVYQNLITMSPLSIFFT